MKPIVFDIPQPFNLKRVSTLVHVTTEGLFTTTLPHEIASMMLDHRIELGNNRLGNPGYFESTTYEGLKAAIQTKIVEMCSEELISECRVLKYSILTEAAYCLGDDGEVYPNGYWLSRGDSSLPPPGGSIWHEGTETRNSNHRGPFGIRIVVIPCVRRDYRYTANDKTRVEYLRFSTHFEVNHEDPWIWLGSLPTMDTVAGGYGVGMLERLDEIEYTVEAGWFFVNLIKSLCLLNEKIKPFLKPDTIQALIAGNVNLLGAPKG